MAHGRTHLSRNAQHLQPIWLYEVTNEEIREAVLEHMQRQGLTKADVARRLGVTHQAVSNILSGRSARVPASLEKLLAEVGLQLVVTPVVSREERK